MAGIGSAAIAVPPVTSVTLLLLWKAGNALSLSAPV
jgi:hypothetical protein